MDQHKRAEALRQIAGELKKVEGAGPEDARHLEGLRLEIDRLLEDQAATPGDSVFESINQLVGRLTEEHPKTAYAINQAAEILGRMGI